jgi:hypothetical protein
VKEHGWTPELASIWFQIFMGAGASTYSPSRGKKGGGDNGVFGSSASDVFSEGSMYESSDNGVFSDQ